MPGSGFVVITGASLLILAGGVSVGTVVLADGVGREAGVCDGAGLVSQTDSGTATGVAAGVSCAGAYSASTPL